jgi:hypothetical protein
MLNKALCAIAVAGLLAAPLDAQTRPQKPQPTPRPEPRTEPAEAPQPAPAAIAMPRPEPQGQPVNVRLRKVITMVVADRQSGSIRSKGVVKIPAEPPSAGTTYVGMAPYRDVTINVDAHPMLLRSPDGNIRVDLGLEYQPTIGGGKGASTEPGTSNLNERISVIVEPGKPLTISQAADPASDRRISVELKATILR